MINGNPNSSFVAEDIRILSQDFEVRPFHCQGKRDIPGLAGALRSADICLSWFVNGYARVAQALCGWRGIPHVAIVGGYEVASEPELDYGIIAQGGLGGFFSRRFLRKVLADASVVVVPSTFSQEEVLSIKEPRRLEIIPLGVDLAKFKPRPKVAGVGTIVGATTPSHLLKGLGTFLEVAAELPEFDFHIVGAVQIQGVHDRAPINVRFDGPLEHEAVAEFLGGLRVYCQLSRRESFGLATAEAMAAGCVPVVTDRGALGEVVGDVGFKVPYGDAASTLDAIRSALAMPSPHDRARRRVEKEFDLQLRRRRLGSLIHSLLAS